MNTRSIRFRLTAWYSGLIAVVLLLFGTFIYLTLQRYLELSLQDALSREARTVGEALLRNVAETGEDYVVKEIEEHFAPRITSHFVRVTREDGSVLYQSGAPRSGVFEPSHIAPARKVEGDSWSTESLPGGQQLLIFSMPYRDAIGKTYYVQAGAPRELAESALRGLAIALAVVFPLAVGAAIGGGYLLTRNALRPLDEIATTAERITSRNLNERMAVSPNGDELEKLALALNRMMARLEESFLHIDRFTADASHEIRTPLAIIRGELEEALRSPGLTLPLQETVASALEEAERLTRIVEQLLDMSRLESGAMRVQRTPFDFVELMGSTVDQMRLLAEEKRLQLRFEAASSLHMDGDPLRLRQVAVNLIDNAIKYTPSGGTVSVSVFRLDGVAVLEVADTGMGIPSEALPYVFDRFYRVDEARSRKEGGTGLGLAIVKSICSVYGGSVTVRAAEVTGTVFRVDFPLKE